MFPKLVAIIGVVLFVAGCSVEGEIEHKSVHYANNSGIAVKIIAIVKDTIDTPSYYHIRHYAYEIELKNDGERSPDFIKDDSGQCNYLYSYYGCKGPIYFRIEFLGEPKTCLVFDGDAKIGDYDIRYWENYTLVSTDVEKMDELTNYYHHYYYYITPELIKLATEESCDP